MLSVTSGILLEPKDVGDASSTIVVVRVGLENPVGLALAEILY